VQFLDEVVDVCLAVGLDPFKRKNEVLVGPALLLQLFDDFDEELVEL